MRASLALAALLLTAGVVLAPGAAARDCAGVVDTDCQSTYCTDLTSDGCMRYEDVYCVIYLDAGRATGGGGDDNGATMLCHATGPFVQGGDCQDPADALCQRTVCIELSHDGCMRYGERTCLLYVNGLVSELTDLTCLPLDGTRPLPNA